MTLVLESWIGGLASESTEVMNGEVFESMNCELDRRSVGVEEAVLGLLVSFPGVSVDSVDAVELVDTTAPEPGVVADNEAAFVVECRLVIGSAFVA